MRNELRQALRESHAVVRGWPARAGRRPSLRVGWVAADTLARTRRAFRSHQPPVSMRINNTAFWMTAYAPQRPERRSIARATVTTPLCSSRRWTLPARRKRVASRKPAAASSSTRTSTTTRSGGSTTWRGTRPTAEQQHDAITMTRARRLGRGRFELRSSVVQKINERSSWIPDNVDLRLFRGRRLPSPWTVTPDLVGDGAQGCAAGDDRGRGLRGPRRRGAHTRLERAA